MQISENDERFFREIRYAALELDSLYKDSVKDRRNLINFLESNNYFEISDLSCDDSAKSLLVHLRLWLIAYKKNDADRLKILVDYGKDLLPEMTASYASYIKKIKLENDANAWQLLDFLLANLSVELMKLDEEGMNALLKNIERELPLVTARLFISFYDDMMKTNKKNGWTYKLESRSSQIGNVSYSIEEFSKMAYCIFNEQYIEKHSLIEKACEKESYANLWAYLSMHFVCGLRSTDIVNIPKPELPYPGNVYREKLLNNEIEDTAIYAEDIQIRIYYKSYYPQKTQRFNRVPEIKVFIPISLEKVLGMILSIAASYKDYVHTGQPFIVPSRNIRIIKDFFGEPFVDTLKGKNFNSRRANKAYLQGIEMASGMDESNKPKGYMLAAIARSHKGSIGTLPDITQIYLRDANFTGYTPEFIAGEMFERGVFGFIPHILLEMYKGNEYTNLHVHKQTELIKTIGVDATSIERFIKLNEKSRQMAVDTVRSVVKDKNQLNDVLQRIATGCSPGKSEGSLCMMMACGQSCLYPERRCCIGCKYEIYTKSVMQHISKEYVRMKGLCSEDDGWRYREMIKNTILPITGEFMATVRLMYQNSDMELLTEIIERGIDNCDSSRKSDRRNKLHKISSGQ